jgi:pseudouridine-5'-phosphate glycosidase
VDNAEFLSGLRSRLGVTNAQSDETEILAALDEALAEQATEATTLPDGVVAIESGVLSQLQADASAGRQALEAQTIARRDGIVTAALTAGKITAAQKQQWRDSLDKDEEGITALLASMAAVVSVDAKAASAVDDSEDALYTKAWGTTQKEG